MKVMRRSEWTAVAVRYNVEQNETGNGWSGYSGSGDGD